MRGGNDKQNNLMNLPPLLVLLAPMGFTNGVVGQEDQQRLKQL
jgi:hypothetical protein